MCMEAELKWIVRNLAEGRHVCIMHTKSYKHSLVTVCAAFTDVSVSQVNVAAIKIWVNRRDSKETPGHILTTKDWIYPRFEICHHTFPPPNSITLFHQRFIFAFYWRGYSCGSKVFSMVAPSVMLNSSTLFIQSDAVLFMLGLKLFFSCSFKMCWKFCKGTQT